MKILLSFFASVVLASSLSAMASVGSFSANMSAAENKSSNMNIMENSLDSNQKLTHYDQLKVYYQQSSLPDFQELTIRRPGRCYEANKPNAPIAAFLLADQTGTSDSLNGPLFPIESKNILSILGNTLLDPTAFDAPNTETQGTIEAYRRSPDHQNRVTLIKNNAWVSYNEGGNLLFQIRKFGHLMIGEFKTLQDTDNYKANSTAYYCYFFKR